MLKQIIIITLIITSLISCNQDDFLYPSTETENPDENNEITNITLGFQRQKPGTNTDGPQHSYVTSGYTIEVIDIWDETSQKLDTLVYTDFDLSQSITFSAVGYVYLKVYHPKYDGVKSSKKAYYSFNDEVYFDDSEMLSVTLDLPQSFCYFVYESEATGKQVKYHKADGVRAQDEYKVVYIPANKPFEVEVCRKQQEPIIIHDAGYEPGQGVYYTILDNSTRTSAIKRQKVISNYSIADFE